MTGLPFSLPGLEQVSDPRQLRSSLLRLTEELQYALSHLGNENFSIETQKQLSDMARSAQKAGELAIQTDQKAQGEFRKMYEQIVQTADQLSSEFTVALMEKEESIISQVTEDFTAKSDTMQLEETFRSELEQTSQKIEMRFSDAASMTEQVEGELEEYRNQVDTYIQFSTDGITLGKRDSPFTAVLGQERLSFLQNGKEIAYLSNNKLYITSTEVLDRFTVGNSASGFFDWIPRANGNLGMKWRQG
nr:MAG TPA: tail protein [Caudoviricetes sp.]